MYNLNIEIKKNEVVIMSNKIYFVEMNKLINLLTSENIPFETRRSWDNTSQVLYPSIKNRICDIVCHSGSIGSKKGLLEIMGLTFDGEDVEGCLTAEEVFTRIKKNYIENS
jgi:hypothetical protein